MTDKDIIRAEIERLKESGCASPIVICDTLLAFIDSLQEEPKPKFKVGDCIKPIDSCLGSQRTICEVCDGWYVTNQGTLDFEYEDNWELVEEPKDKCNGCNNAKGCVTCVDGSEWAHYKEPVSEDLEDAAYNFVMDNYGNPKESLFLFDQRCFRAGAKWQKEKLWKPADGDDLPEYEREVVVFTQNYPDDAGMMMVAIGHRPTPEGFDGKSLVTGEVEHYTPKTYDKGGWNIPDVKYWLDCDLPEEKDEL